MEVKLYHAKAKKIYRKANPEKDFLRMVMDKMEDVPTRYPSTALIKECSELFAISETTADSVCALEAIYEALDIIDQRIVESTHCDKNSLFKNA
jgi:hypothetical protein